MFLKTFCQWDNWQRQYVEKTYDRIRSAYMLFYDRIEPQDTLFSSLSDTKTKAISNEHYIRGISNETYKKIWDENSTFLRDRQLFDPSYFDFMRNIHQLHVFNPVLDYPDDPDKNLNELLEKDTAFPTIKLATEFVIDVIAHSQNSPNFKSWIKLLKNMFAQHIPACLWFLHKLMENKMIKEMLLECTEEKIRIGFADLMVHVLNRLKDFERKYYSQLVDLEKKGSPDKTEIEQRPKSWVIRFMNVYFSFLEDSRVHWKKFKQYFWVIREFCTFGWQEREYFLHKDILSEYTDYFMGRTKTGQLRRVPVMDNYNLPDLTEFISTLSYIVRGCETGSTKGPPPSTIDDGKLLQIPKKEREIFFEKNFLTSMLEMDYNTEAAIEILLHMSWEDLGQTKEILEIIMGEVGKGWVAEKLPVYKTLLDALLQLNDSLQTTRITMACTPFTSGNIALLPPFCSLMAQFVQNIKQAQPREPLP